MPGAPLQGHMLAGLRVLEIEGIGPGPFAAMTLADLGADVIVVHRRQGKTTPGPQVAPMLLDRGKRSIALDLKDPADLATVKALIRRSDALIEGFRPGVMERLGLGPEIAHSIQPALVYGRMTGWGQTGPRALSAGHDMNYTALAGALHYASLPGAPPIAPPTMIGDVGGALYLVIGLLSGIMNARATGRGCVVDAAIVDGTAHMMNLFMALGSVGGLSMQRGESLLDGPHWSRTYRCADGRYISVQCLEPQFYAQFLSLMGLADDPAFQAQMDRPAWPALGRRLDEIFASRPLAHWTSLFDGTDACVAPVLDPTAAASDAHMGARGTWITPADGSGLQGAPAPRFNAASTTPGKVPARGEHTDEILSELAAGA